MIVSLTIRSTVIMREHRPTSFASFFLILFSLLLCCYGLLFCSKSLAISKLYKNEQKDFFNHFYSSVPEVSTPDQITFVTRSGSSLMLGGNKFRFSGPNIFWLGLLQRPEGIRYPSQFEVDDAIATAADMGATVVRSHTLGNSVGCKLCVEPTLGTFNQQALEHIDYAIQSARKHHIKLIIPLVDNWYFYHGGKRTFTNWRNIPNEDNFYSNPQVIYDFKKYISTLLNHKNSYSGITYKDDPTIMAWETGNELSAPTNWVQNISSYIKSIDANHLIVDGNSGGLGHPLSFQEDLNINSIDIYAGHFYP